MSEQERIAALEKRLTQTQNILGTLISWIAQSANSPLSKADAQMMLRLIEEDRHA